MEKISNFISNLIARKWFKISAISLMVLAGIAICIIGNSAKNPIIIALGFLLLFGGVLLFFSLRDLQGTRIVPGKKKLEQPANTLVIQESELDFDYVKTPPGEQQRCINNGKWYFVLEKWPKRKAKRFQLPDDDEQSRFYDPREFANPVTMPANKKLFEPAPSLIKTITVGIMGVAVCVMAVVIVIMTGA